MAMDMVSVLFLESFSKTGGGGMQSRTISFLWLLLFSGALSVGLSSITAAGTGDPNEEAAVMPKSSLTTQAEVTAQAVPTVSGISYYSVSYADFFPYEDGVAKQVLSGLGAYTTAGNTTAGTLVAKTDLPHGAFIYDVTVWGGAGGRVMLRRANNGVYIWETLADVTLPAGTGIVSTTFVLPSPVQVDTGQASYHLQILSYSSATAILGARIGYRMDAGSFYYIPAKTGEGSVIYLK